MCVLWWRVVMMLWVIKLWIFLNVWSSSLFRRFDRRRVRSSRRWRFCVRILSCDVFIVVIVVNYLCKLFVCLLCVCLFVLCCCVCRSSRRFRRSVSRCCILWIIMLFLVFFCLLMLCRCVMCISVWCFVCILIVCVVMCVCFLSLNVCMIVLWMWWCGSDMMLCLCWGVCDCLWRWLMWRRWMWCVWWWGVRVSVGCWEVWTRTRARVGAATRTRYRWRSYNDCVVSCMMSVCWSVVGVCCELVCDWNWLGWMRCMWVCVWRARDERAFDFVDSTARALEIIIVYMYNVIYVLLWNGVLRWCLCVMFCYYCFVFC